MSVKQIRLKDKNSIPQIGLGTWKLWGDECIKVVEDALEIGYRHIDTADLYGNHKEIGIALKNTGIDRSKLFITSKVGPENFEYKELIATAKRSLDEMGIDYFDMYLMHRYGTDEGLKGSLHAMRELVRQGLTKSFGVSNFTENEMKKALDITPEIVTNQIEFHPTLNQKKLHKFCKSHKVTITAYCPLARGYDLKLEEVVEISEAKDIPPAQVVLAFLIQKGIIIIPNASSKEHLISNFQSSEVNLNEKEMKIMENLNENYRIVEI